MEPVGLQECGMVLSFSWCVGLIRGSLARFTAAGLTVRDHPRQQPRRDHSQYLHRAIDYPSFRT